MSSRILIERTWHDIRVNYEGNTKEDIMKMIIQSAQTDEDLRTIILVSAQVIQDMEEQKDKIKHKN